jgi:hypothetical protein
MKCHVRCAALKSSHVLERSQKSCGKIVDIPKLFILETFTGVRLRRSAKFPATKWFTVSMPDHIQTATQADKEEAEGGLRLHQGQVHQGPAQEAVDHDL